MDSDHEGGSDMEMFATIEQPSAEGPRGVLGYKRDGGVRRIFLGLKFSTPVFFWIEDLTMYFFGSEKSARIFLGSNFRQANSSYAIQAKVPARSESMNRIISSLVFFWVHNIRSMYFFGCKILGSVGPPRHVYTRVPPLGGGQPIFSRQNETVNGIWNKLLFYR